jgi:hypothetical protein
MTLEIRRDSNGSPFVEWCQGIDEKTQSHIKRAWVQHRSGTKDWGKGWPVSARSASW